MQSFILTEDEHRARAMLLGRKFFKTLHLYGIEGNQKDYLEADTLEPVGIGGHGYKVHRGEKGCKASS